MQNTPYIKKTNRIYLSGGGDENQSFHLDKFFFNTLSKNKRFLYIPIALRGKKLYNKAHLWMKSIIKLHEREDVNFDMVDDLSGYDQEVLKEFDGVYIGGGNTWSLIQEFRESGFSHMLLKYIEEGGRVYGGSAGAIIMGKRIDTQDDENKLNIKNLSGLSVLGEFSVACHYKDAQSNLFKEWSSDNGLPIICIPEESGLIVENNMALCVGTKPCTIYFSNGTVKVLAQKESFNM